jgi:hypothetical protein
MVAVEVLFSEGLLKLHERISIHVPGGTYSDTTSPIKIA